MTGMCIAGGGGGGGGGVLVCPSLPTDLANPSRELERYPSTGNPRSYLTVAIQTDGSYGVQGSCSKRFTSLLFYWLPFLNIR